MKKIVKILVMVLFGALLLMGCGNRAVEQNTPTTKDDEVETTVNVDNKETTSKDDVSKPVTEADKEPTTPVEPTTEKKENIIEGTYIRMEGDTLTILGPEIVDGNTFVDDFAVAIKRYIVDNYESEESYANKSIAWVLSQMREQGKWVPIIKHVKFDEGITEIQDFQMEDLEVLKYLGNEELESIEFPKSLMMIEDSFRIFDSEIHEGDEIKENSDVPGFVREENGFYYIGSLLVKAPDVTEIIVPQGITVMAEGTFSECTTAERIVLPEGIKYINDDLFDRGVEYSNLKVIELPKSIEYIADDAFDEVETVKIIFPRECNIRNVGTIVNGEREIDWGVELENGLAIVNGMLVEAADALGNIVIPDGVVEISRWAFKENVNLTGVTIPESVVVIGGSAFYGCTALESIEISSGVREIGNGVFSGCAGLKEIVIPKNVTVMGTDVCADCTSLTSVVLPEGITEIPGGMFRRCSSLTSIVIPNGVTKIGSGAFDRCLALAEVKIPGSLTFIDEYTFSGLQSLVSVEISEGVTGIGKKAFEGCSALTAIKLPDSLTDIGASAFYGCTSLVSIKIPVGVTSISDRAFCECKSLVNVEIPESVTSILDNAFWNCSSLKKVIIPETVTEIDDHAFFGSGVTIYGKAGSYAESFAANRYHPFVAQ